MPNPQPTQMGQRMEPSPIERLAEHLAARPMPQDHERVADWLDYSLNRCGLIVVTEQSLTRPTADLGDDGELVARLRDPTRAFSASREAKEAADRLILYLEAREVLANRIAAAIQQARDEIGATEQQRLAFAYAEAAMRAALTRARQEGDK